MNASSTSRTPRTFRRRARVSRIPFITPERTHLKAAMAGLVRRITVGNVGPRSAGPQCPQNAVQNGASILPRSSTSIFARYRFRNEAFERCPLSVGQVSRRLRYRFDGWKSGGELMFFVLSIVS